MTPTVLMRERYAEVRAYADTQTTEILIYGDIGEDWWNPEESLTAKKVVEALNGITGGTLVVRINSFGGVVPDALAIYNAIRRKTQCTVRRVVIDGVAMSAASLIAMAADPGELQVSANALTMIHAPWTAGMGNAQKMRELADQLDAWARAMSTCYARGGMTEADALALLTDGADHYYTAAELVAAGLADQIVEDPTQAPAAALELTAVRAMAMSRYRRPAPSAGRPHAAAAAPPQEVQPMPTATAPATAPTVADPQTPDPQAPTAPTPEPAPDQIEARARALIVAHGEALDREFAPLLALPNNPHAALLTAAISAAKTDLSQTPDVVRAKVLAELGRTTQEPIMSYTRISAGEDEADKRRAAATSWLLVRAGLRQIRDAHGKDQPLALEANPFRGHSLLDIARACLRASGRNPDGMDKLAIVAAAFQTTGDFPTLLENTLHKVLLNAYRTASDKWRRFCKVGTVADFRAHNRYRVGSIGVFDSLTEHGEFKNKAIPDGEKGSITASTKGNIIAVTREAIINDDLGAMTDLATALGRAGARTIEVGVFSRLAENAGCGPTMSDGYALFDSHHGNKEATTKGAPSVSTIAANRILLASQKDVGGNDYLDLVPTIWLGSLTDGDAARVVNGSQYDPDTANKLQRNNPVFGIFTDIIDTARITGRYWYTFADPNEAPVFEVAFLDGMQEPYIETRNGWSVDGAEIKGRLDFGVAAIDYRGAARNDGA